MVSHRVRRGLSNRRCGRTFRKLRELPIGLWGLWVSDGAGGTDVCGMLPGRERCEGGGEMVRFMRDGVRAWMSRHATDYWTLSYRFGLSVY